MAEDNLSHVPVNGTTRADGLVFYAGKWRSRQSIEKQRAREKQQRRDNPELQAEKMRRARAAKPEHYWHAARKFRATLKGRVAQLYNNAAGRCKRYGGDITIDRQWIMDRVKDGECAVTGIPFDLALSPDTRFNPWAPSLDQIEPGKGYTPENTQVVCNVHNACKNEWSEEVHRKYIEACARRYGLIK